MAREKGRGWKKKQVGRSREREREREKIVIFQEAPSEVERVFTALLKKVCFTGGDNETSASAGLASGRKWCFKN